MSNTPVPPGGPSAPPFSSASVAETDPLRRLGACVRLAVERLSREFAAAGWADLQPVQLHRRQAVSEAGDARLELISTCSALGLPWDRIRLVADEAERLIGELSNARSRPRPAARLLPDVEAPYERKYRELYDTFMTIQISVGRWERHLADLVAEAEGRRRSEAAKERASANSPEAQSARHDGPTAKLKFWWGGRCNQMTTAEGQKWNVLNIMWPYYPGGKLNVDDFADEWPNKLSRHSLKKTVRARLTEASGFLATIGVPYRLELVGDYIHWVRQNSAE